MLTHNISIEHCSTLHSVGSSPKPASVTRYPTRTRQQRTRQKVYLEDLVLLQHLTGDVEGKVLAVNNALDKAQVLRDEVITVVHDEHTSHIQLDVVLLLLGVKQVKRCTPAVSSHVVGRQSIVKFHCSQQPSKCGRRWQMLL